MEKLILHLCRYLINSIYVSLFNLANLFHFKYHDKIIKRKLCTSIKHHLIIGRDMPETRRQKLLLKSLY